MKRDDAMIDIVSEYDRATQKFGRFNSSHEGYAVIKEEFDELWDHIKNKGSEDWQLKEEATQVGAMVLRFLVDCVS